MVLTGRNWRACIALIAALTLAACSTTKAPVAGPGEYVVQPGDTLYRIASKTGRSAGDIARWSNLQDPDRLEAGQVLRVAPPGAASAARSPDASAPPSPTARAAGAMAPKPPRPAAREPDPVVPPAARRSDWSWPAPGQVVAGFNGTSNKGVDIGGNTGDPVVSIGNGSVAVTETLRGYGSVLMVDHGGAYMSVYTNVRSVLVKQGQRVQRGQKIAEIGTPDAGSPKLHFEIRYRGKAVDPRQYLPAR